MHVDNLVLVFIWFVHYRVASGEHAGNECRPVSRSPAEIGATPSAPSAHQIPGTMTFFLLIILHLFL